MAVYENIPGIGPGANTEYQPLERQQPGLKTGEQTGFQAVITSPWVMRWAAVPATYAVYREIRKHPTIALARQLAAAPIMAAEWSVESDDNTPAEMVELIQDLFLPKRQKYLEHVLLYGNVDFGYMPFEKVFAPRDGYMDLVKLKPLLHDITEICIGHQGQFIGFRQIGTELGLDNAMYVGFRVEGSYLYGVPLLENVRQIYNWWIDCNEGARRYDLKIAGAHIVVQYPVGVSKDEHGLETDNSVLAARVLHSLEAAGGVAIPRDVAQWMQQLGTDNPGWKIDIMDHGTNQQESFINRLDYLDKLLCRGILFPERAVLEGTHGTKAEARQHFDVAMTIADLTHKKVTDEINQQVVDQVLVLNFGPSAKGMVHLEASPIVNTRREFLEDVYKAFLADPNGFAETSGMTDMDAMLDTLGIPKAKETDKAGDMLNVPEQAAPSPPIKGMDTNAPVAASTRRLYRNLYGKVVDEQFDRLSLGAPIGNQNAYKGEMTKDHIKSAGKLLKPAGGGFVGHSPDSTRAYHEALFSPIKSELENRWYSTEINHSDSTNSSYMKIRDGSETQGEVRISDHPKPGFTGNNRHVTSAGTVIHSILPSSKPMGEIAERFNSVLRDFPGAGKSSGLANKSVLGVVFSQPVSDIEGVRFDDSPIDELPDVRQPNNYACGACSAMAVGRFFGVGPETEPEWEEALGTTEAHSTSPQAIATYLMSLGLSVEARQGMTVNDLAEAIAGGKLVICPGQYYMEQRDPSAEWKYGHWQVVFRVLPDMVLVQDSSLENLEHEPGGDVPQSQADPDTSGAAPGVKPILIDDWNSRWHDVGEPGPNGEPGEKYVRYGIVVGPIVAEVRPGRGTSSLGLSLEETKIKELSK